MQSDDVIWSVINQQFCSYKVKYVFSLLRFRHISLFFLSGPRRKIFVGMNIMSQASAVDNRVLWQILAMQRLEKKKVCIQCKSNCFKAHFFQVSYTST